MYEYVPKHILRFFGQSFNCKVYESLCASKDPDDQTGTKTLNQTRDTINLDLRHAADLVEPILLQFHRVWTEM